MRKFEVCMEPCAETRAKQLKAATVAQWYSICAAAKENPKGGSGVLLVQYNMTVKL